MPYIVGSRLRGTDRVFDNLQLAENYARRSVKQTGEVLNIYEGGHSAISSFCLATVSRDALGRVWTDSMSIDGPVFDFPVICKNKVV